MTNLIEKLKKQYSKSIEYEYSKHRYSVSVPAWGWIIRDINCSHRHALVGVDVVNDWYDPNDSTDPDCGSPESNLNFELPREFESFKRTLNSQSFIRIRHIRIWDRNDRDCYGYHAPWDIWPR